jgi:UV DNA damage endonuclease
MINGKTRLGYACINTYLKKNHKISCNTTCRLGTAIGKGQNTGYPKGSVEYSNSIYTFLAEYGRNNLTSMFKIISWSRKNGIFFYRMSSDMFPHMNNLKLKPHMTEEDWKKYTDFYFARDIIRDIGAYAQKYQIRLTMHPGHYNQLGSETQSVVLNTMLDLSWHAKLLYLLSDGADKYIEYLKLNDRECNDNNNNNIFDDSVLCVHGGGTYKDKKATLDRWKSNYLKLPDYIKSRLALENDEKCYSVEDLLPLCNDIRIPLIFDFHHYDCWDYYHQDNPYQKPITDLMPKILQTWDCRGIVPKFHLSDQAKGKKCGAHHDYVESIPNELITLINDGVVFDIMVEAKMKEQATLKLYKKYI